MWQETLAGFAPICRLPKDDCGTPRRPILCEPAGHTRIRTATSRVGRHAGNVFRISVSFPPGESAASLYACFYLKEFDCPAVVRKNRLEIGGIALKHRPKAGKDVAEATDTPPPNYQFLRSLLFR